MPLLNSVLDSEQPSDDTAGKICLLYTTNTEQQVALGSIHTYILYM